MTEPTALDRALAALRMLVKSFFPALVYWITHEYAVEESDGRTFSGRPTDPTFSPQIPVGVPYSPALAGAYSVVPKGTLAYVAFANADPSKPFLVRFAAGATSTTTTIDATDGITLGGSSTLVTLGSGRVALAIGAETYYLVCYGDQVNVPVVGGVVAQGAITQNPATAPNSIAKVRITP